MPDYLHKQPNGGLFRKPNPAPSRAHMDILRLAGIRVQPLKHKKDDSFWVATGRVAQAYRSERNQYGKEHNNNHGTLKDEQARESDFIDRRLSKHQRDKKSWNNYYKRHGIDREHSPASQERSQLPPQSFTAQSYQSSSSSQYAQNPDFSTPRSPRVSTSSLTTAEEAKNYRELLPKEVQYEFSKLALAEREKDKQSTLGQIYTRVRKTMGLKKTGEYLKK